MIVPVFLSVGLLWANSIVKDLQDTLDEVTIDAEKAEEVITEVTILVLKDSEVSNITEMKEFMIGCMGGGLEEDSQMQEEINASLKESPQYTTFEDVYSLVDALYAKTANAIIMDKACVRAVPEITANHIDASLIHDAAIGKIAGEQLIKLMTLGLTEAEAEAQIVSGFLK